MLRSLLFVPGYTDMLEKAWKRCQKADAIIPDLEDSVPEQEKENARKAVCEFLSKVEQTHSSPLLIPRVNSFFSPHFSEDVESVLASGGKKLYGISVGKVDTAEEMASISEFISRAEKKSGVKEGSVKLVPWLETAKGIVNAFPISSSSPRIVGVAYGADDYRADMQISRSAEEASRFARHCISVAARAAGVLALDTPWVAIKDIAGLDKYVSETKDMGYKGMFAIHPSHLDNLNSGFSPSREEVEGAIKIVEAFEEAVRQGKGSTSVDSKMVDIPVYRRSKRLLQIAKQMESKSK